MTKTQRPPALDARQSLPLDEVTQTYARELARQCARPTVPAPALRDQVELEVGAMFTAVRIVADGAPPPHALVRAVARRIR